MARATASDWNPDGRLSPGSTLYYLARFSPPSRRADTAVVLAWHETLTGIRRVSEPGVALAKLRWWRDEIERALSGNPI